MLKTGGINISNSHTQVTLSVSPTRAGPNKNERIKGDNMKLDKSKAVKIAYLLVPIVGVLVGGALAPEQTEKLMQILTDIITMFAQ
ncbi:hypothetical protein FBHYGVHD_CDS0042 [Staphylococcus phage MVC_VPHSA1]|uniref:Uncharacterized protein n=1 Tax=Staphylococcus phage MVC_VPHSA1 TaxID=3088876 RepID=A0ABZ0QZF6_9CAUD|nr:hypothetical protein FBHYGVHD_CDS0042 [Staphylococcus phage MVC_VPHSA1]